MKRTKNYNIKVAFYSGVIPASTFIENSIKGISESGIVVYLFGQKTKAYLSTNNNIKVFATPTNKISKLIFLMKNFTILLIKNPFLLIKAVSFYFKIAMKKGYSFIEWGSKFLPIMINPPDIIHIQWAKSLSDLFFLKKLLGVKFILSLRGAHINYSPIAEPDLANEYRKLFPLLDGFHAVSTSISREAQRYGAIKDKIKVVHSSINQNKLNSFQKNSLEFKNKIRIISVGRHHWKKGYRYALLAMKRLIEQEFEIEYLILAKDRPDEEIVYQIDQLSLSSIVRLISVKCQEDIYKMMVESDCLLLPSLEEGISNTVLEAMYIGLPVISSDCGGMKEIIEDGYNGILFSNWNIDAMVKALTVFIKSPLEKKVKLATKAKKTVTENHSIINHGNELKVLYENVLQKGFIQ